MALSAQVTVGTGATALYKADADAINLGVSNRGTASVFLGGSNVTTSNGFELKQNEILVPITVYPNEVLYGVVASATQRVDVLAFGSL